MAIIKKGLRIFIDVVFWAALACSIFITIMVFVSQSNNGVPTLFGKMPFSIQTPSMEPALMVNDLVISEKINNLSDLKEGDIITFWTMIEDKKAINTHRIIEVVDEAGSVSFKTKGDNNRIEDKLLVYPADLIGKYTGMKISGFGKVVDYLKSPSGFLICIVLPLLLFFLYELYSFIKLLLESKSRKLVAELTETQKQAAIEEYLATQSEIDSKKELKQ